MASPSRIGARLDRLAFEQRRLLERKRNPDRKLVREPAELSSAQMRIWLFCRQHPGSLAYHLPRAFEVKGRLDRQLLTAALGCMAARHVALRTAIRESGGRPVPVILQPVPPSLPVVELHEGEIEAWVRRETARPFDLQTGPPFRAVLGRLGPDRHVFLEVWHNIVTDLRSCEIFDRELGELYAGHELAGAAPGNGDYAKWERVWHRSAGAKTFWKDDLAGANPLIDLACGRPRAAGQRHIGQVRSFDPGEDLAGQIREFGLTHDLPLFAIFLAAWAVLLSRYSNQDDLVIGVPAAGRTVPEFDRVIGHFANILPVRLAIGRDIPFADLARYCRDRYLKCSRNALPLDAILEAVSPARSLSYSPVFQVALNYLEGGGENLHFAGASTRRIPVHNGASLLDLTLTVADKPGRLAFEIEYDSDLFDARTVCQMGGHLIGILREGTGPRATGVAGIRMLSAEERHELLARGSGPAETPAPGETVLTLFERQAAENPGAPAILCDAPSWDYGALNAFAGRVRNALEMNGIRPGDVVAVEAERSPEIVGIALGIWKCGAVWLPLDPRWPEDRKQFAIADSGAKLAIDSGWLRGRLRSKAGGSQTTIATDSLAYLLYTSGSTGRPKGVAVRHSSLVNLLRSMRRQPGLSADDTLLSVTPLTFDISLNELFLPLSVGARLILPNLETATDALAVRRLLEGNPVTVMQATPAMWRSLIHGGWNGSPRLRAWCGGEAMTPELAGALLDRVSELWNLYGPTETTIYSTAHRVRRGESPVPIGLPIDNTQCYVLDSRLEPVPDGVAGDLYIGGAGLAAGYIGHAAAATAQSFLPNPFVPATSMYRTGDIARRSHSGELVFLYRKDTQVKVRGHRIELEEVQSALSGIADVRDAAVRVQGDSLAAYVVPADPRRWDPRQLRRELQAKLPEYMIPAVFVCMESLPLTSNGKVDLVRLPPAHPTPLAPAGPMEQGAPIEERLRAIWEELLSIHPIGLEDDFFTLGGHSILAAAMFAHIEKDFGRQMPISTLFRAPTIKELAVEIRRTGQDPVWSQVVPMRAGGSGAALFCLPPENALAFRALADAMGGGCPIYALQPPGLDGDAPPETSVEGLALRAMEAMRTVQPRGPYFLAGYSFGGYTAYEMACRLAREGEAVSLAVIDTDLLVLPAYWSRLSWLRRMGYFGQRALDYAKGLLGRSAADRAWHLKSLKELWRYRVFGEPVRLEDDGATLTSAARRVREGSNAAFDCFVPKPSALPVLFLQSRGVPTRSRDSHSHGWKGLVGPRNVKVVPIAGADHDSILDNPCVGQLAAALRDWMSG